MPDAENGRLNIRSIDADALMDKTVHMAKECFGVGQCYCLRTQFQKMIEDALTIDAVPIVRCGDCRWWSKDEPDDEYGYCYNGKIIGSTKENWY